MSLDIQVAIIFDMVRPQPLILLRIDKPDRLSSWPFFFVKIEAGNHPFNESQLVVAVQNLEILIEFCILPMGSKQTMSKTMERADPHASKRRTHQRLNARPHLSGSLVCKSHGENAMGRYTVSLNHPGDTMSQHASLAAAGTGED